MLAGQMPEQSAFAAAHRGGSEFRPWTTQTYLLTAITNLLFAANRQRGGKPTRKPMVSPPDPSKKARKVTVAQLLASAEDREKES